MRTFYLSFATQSAFLGACLMDAEDVDTAIARCEEMGLNPGGEIMILDITDAPACPFPKHRLMSRSDIEAMDGPATRIGDLSDEKLDQLNAASARICEECNSVGVTIKEEACD